MIRLLPITESQILMKRITYKKYVPDPASEMSMEDLLSALSDYLLNSGFQSQYGFYEMQDPEQSLDELRRAIEAALTEGDMVDENMRERLQQMQMDGTLDAADRKAHPAHGAGRLHQHRPAARSGAEALVGGQVGQSQAQARFEITDKSLDFLGYQDAARPAGLAGKVQLRTPRHPGYGYRD